MAKRKLPFLTGWCDTAGKIERGEVTSKQPVEYWHNACRGGCPLPPQAVTRVEGKKEITAIEDREPVYCSCPCHEGKEIKVVKTESVAKARIEKASADGTGPQGRNKKLRESIAAELQQRRYFEMPSTGDDYEDRKLACRFHSAAGSVGLKVKTSCKGGKITATVK